MRRLLSVRGIPVAVVSAALLASGCGGSPTSDQAGTSATSNAEAARGQGGSSRVAAAAEVSAADTLRAVVAGFRDGEAEAVWNALPAGHQRDVNELLRDFGRQMDAELWDRLRTVADKLAALLRERKELILAYPPLKEDPLFASGPLKQVAANWHVAVGLLEALAGADLETLKTFDGRSVFSRFGRDGLKRLKQLSVLLPEDNAYSALDALLAGAEVREIETSGDRATVEIAPAEGEPRRFEFVRVEGRWFPASWQQSWAAEMTAARNKLRAELAPDVLAQKKQALLPRLAAFEQSLDRLAAVPDGREFYDVLDRELLPVLSGTPPASAAGAGAERSRGRGGSVTVEFTTRLDERTEDAVAQALVGLCDQPDGIVLPRGGGAGTRLEVSPVSDVRAFAGRIRFGRVTAVDAERRTVTVDVSAGAFDR